MKPMPETVFYCCVLVMLVAVIARLVLLPLLASLL